MKSLLRHFLIAGSLFGMFTCSAAQTVAPPGNSVGTDNRVKALNAEGLELSNANRHAAAVEIFQQVATLTPDDGDIQCNLGVELAEVRRFGEAATALERAASLMPWSIPSHYNLGAVYRHLRRNSEARSEFTRVVENKPQTDREWGMVCLARSALDQPLQAVACYEKRMRFAPWDAETIADYAFALNSTKQHEKAISLLENAPGLTRNSAQAQNELGFALAQTKRYRQAFAALTSAVELDPEDERTRFNLVVVSLAVRNRDAALEQYSFLKQLNPELAQKAYAMIFNKYIVDFSNRKGRSQ